MKKNYLCLCLVLAMACSEKKEVSIIVSNSSSIDRIQEITEVSPGEFPTLQEITASPFIITDASGTEVAYQFTYDDKLIFPATVKANSQSTYYLKPGAPAPVDTIACGRYYPERVDDIAWENDRIAFRTYGPALQATRERAFGYDIWTKRVDYPVVKARYDKELNPESLAQIAELRKTDPKAASKLANSISYHNDHGDGLDYYSVGPTLGGGTSALMHNDSIIYPYCYKSYQILDNGPLRFTMKLEYHPFTVGNDESVTESRLISLDAGSQLNKAEIVYENLSGYSTPSVASGIVLHAPSDQFQFNKEKGYMAYAEPIDPVNGQIYVGAVFPQTDHIKEIKPIYFSYEEKKIRGNANGHLLGISEYSPNTAYTYYFGGGWNKWGFNSPEKWFSYMEEFAEKIQNPLTIQVK